MYHSKKYELNPPSLEELSKVFNEELKNQFKSCSVSVEDCPDLTKAPFNLTGSGLGGKTAIADVGGVEFLAPIPRKEKIYSFELVADKVDIGPDAFMIGASAGPYKTVGCNCEFMPNATLRKEGDHFKVVENNSYHAKILNDTYNLAPTPSSEFAILGNLFVSEGKPGKVIKIEAEHRLGKDDFITTLQKILQSKFSKPVSMGGVFLIQKGKAILHIMPDFPKEPFRSEEDVNKWLRFFTMDSPLVCLTTLHSVDPDLNLRMEHTHCFSDHNQGGHYHYDTTPDEVKYVAYLNVAQTIVRVDQPPNNLSKGH